jgi:hypothetical protein
MVVESMGRCGARHGAVRGVFGSERALNMGVAVEFVQSPRATRSRRARATGADHEDSVSA